MYDTCVTLAKQHSPEITIKAARLICDKKTSYFSQLAPETLNEQLGPILQMQLRYLETSDLEEWKNFCIQEVRRWMAEGVEYSSVILVMQCLMTALDQYFKDNLPLLETIDGLPADKVLSSLQRRLMGLNTVAASTIMTTGLLSTGSSASDLS